MPVHKWRIIKTITWNYKWGDWMLISPGGDFWMFRDWHDAVNYFPIARILPRQ